MDTGGGLLSLRLNFLESFENKYRVKRREGVGDGTVLTRIWGKLATGERQSRGDVEMRGSCDALRLKMKEDGLASSLGMRERGWGPGMRRSSVPDCSWGVSYYSRKSNTHPRAGSLD